MTEINDVIVEEKTMSCLTTKEIKALARPEFRENPDKFYPTQILKKLEFDRYLCTKCDGFFWMHTSCSEEQKTVPVCGDSNCIGEYTFINKGTGIGDVKTRAKDFHYTYSQAWADFSKAMQSSRIPIKPIDKYPTVARWRADVDFTAAGIYCFQPYCVTGELEAPENPLCCPQFCVRFNDLDNIGLTGRHYSGFIMLGIQCFNLPQNFIMFKEETVEFNLRWLHEFLQVPYNEIFLREDVWAGGGNLGPCMEYFIGGLEVGNMVFMQYKTFPDGSREELKVKVIDCGIGLERIPWLVNGSPTSYCDVFEGAIAQLNSKLELDVWNDVWKKFGPLSSQLDVDECPDLEKTWADIAKVVDMDVKTVKQNISPIKDMYIILDHTRSAMMLITDGALPSSKGGGYNIRNILRRCFEKLISNKKGDVSWWDTIGGMDGFLEIFESHKQDLAKIYGEFKEYKSFKDIIEKEWNKYSEQTSGEDQLKKLLKKRNNKLTIDDWIICMQTHGIPADKIAQISKNDMPNNLYYEIATREERQTKQPETVLYDTSELVPTEMLYLVEPDKHAFTAKVVTILQDLTKPEPYPRSVVVLDRTAFYPTSGGQNCDKGTLSIDGQDYSVVNCEKVGHCVTHMLDRPVPDSVQENTLVSGVIDSKLRNQHKAHHTATHIVFSACRQVLGPHVWQNGAHKSEQYAHIDISHYASVTPDQEKEIERIANAVVQQNAHITKTYYNKKEAELKWGFDLYQGGAIPSTNIRVVQIEGIDTEACCGTHCDSTGEVGRIKLLKVSRISDGVVRFYYVAGEKSNERLDYEAEVLKKVAEIYSVSYSDLVQTSTRVFRDMKSYGEKLKKQDKKLLDLQVNLAYSTDKSVVVVKSDQPNATLFFKFLKAHAQKLSKQVKGVIFYNESYVYGLVGDKTLVNLAELCTLLEVDQKEVKSSNKVDYNDKEKKIKFKVDNILEFGIISSKKDKENPEAVKKFNESKFIEYCNLQGWELAED